MLWYARGSIEIRGVTTKKVLKIGTRKCAVDYYTTAYRRSETDVAYSGATWRVTFLHIRYRPIE